jgi:thiosulfate reductase cytochrome b subunit
VAALEQRNLVVSPIGARMTQAVSTATLPRETITAPLYYRHRLPVRIMHWINVVALTVLFMSGLQIFNAHPRLYWGKSSYTGNPPLLEIGAREGPGGSAQGYTRIFGHDFNTTGVLGLSQDSGRAYMQGFPDWITLPSHQWLSMARTWHFFFAWVFVINGLCYLIYTIMSRHLARDLWPTPMDWRSIGASFRDHLRFRHPTGEAAKYYNVLQKLTYLIVIFVLLPLIVLMGMAMSPTLDTILTGWVDVFGGRQSARTIHFLIAWALVAFVAIHVFEVIITGLWNNLRSMITGRYRVPQETRHG